MPELLKGEFHQLADGGRLRYARFAPAQKPRGTILIAPGRREFIEKKHAELGEEFLKRGYALIIFEWRGQGLSSRFLSGPSYQREYIADFSVYLDDLRSFYSAVVRPSLATPLILCAHSLGAHLFMRWLAEDKPAEVAGATFTAPMLALTLKTAQRIAQGLCSVAVHMGHGTDYAPSQNDYLDADRTFANNPLTQDPERFTIIQRYFDSVPELTVGGVTWQWLYAALQSMHKLDQPEYLAQIKVPVQAIMGGKDHVTPAAQLTHYLKLIPNSDEVVIPGAMHDVMNEIDAYQREAWAQIDRFLGKITAS
jgi:lysophospholipase